MSNNFLQILLAELKDVFHTEGDEITFSGNSLGSLITELEKSKQKDNAIDELVEALEKAANKIKELSLNDLPDIKVAQEAAKFRAIAKKHKTNKG